MFNNIKTKILGVVKRNPLFLHEIEWKNNGFLFTTPNIRGSKSRRGNRCASMEMFICTFLM